MVFLLFCCCDENNMLCFFVISRFGHFSENALIQYPHLFCTNFFISFLSEIVTTPEVKFAVYFLKGGGTWDFSHQF